MKNIPKLKHSFNNLKSNPKVTIFNRNIESDELDNDKQHTNYKNNKPSNNRSILKNNTLMPTRTKKVSSLYDTLINKVPKYKE